MNDGNKRPLALIILDGWGDSPHTEGNAIALAHTPFYDEICRKYPRTSLAAAGVRVGLPPQAAGNAEVGHASIGAGRIVQTAVSRIEQAVRSGAFFENEVLKRAFAKARTNNSAVHLVGLVSDGGVHSSMENLYALLRMAKKEEIKDVFVHGILDGRDVSPRTADIYVEALEIKMADIGLGQIATLCGRFFAMDDDENWERTARAYTMLVHSEGERTTDAIGTIRNSFLRGIYDEFIAPIVLEKEPGVPVASVNSGDLVVFFNHRRDAIRQLVQSMNNGNATATGKPNIEIVCLTEYDRSFGLPVAFEPEAQHNTLAHIFSEKDIANYRISETERFRHMTHLFDGRATLSQPEERQIFVPSLGPEACETQPEMRSFKIADKFIRELESDPSGVFIVNLPAADMVAESGNLEKTIEAVQFVDTCLGGILEKIQEIKGVAVITSTHGNCEEMANLLTGEPDYSPTSNPVPFVFVNEEANGLTLRQDGSLENVAPTILGILGIEKPAEMTGTDLRVF